MKEKNLLYKGRDCPPLGWITAWQTVLLTMPTLLAILRTARKCYAPIHAAIGLTLDQWLQWVLDSLTLFSSGSWVPNKWIKRACFVTRNGPTNPWSRLTFWHIPGISEWALRFAPGFQVSLMVSWQFDHLTKHPATFLSQKTARVCVKSPWFFFDT